MSLSHGRGQAKPQAALDLHDFGGLLAAQLIELIDVLLGHVLDLRLGGLGLIFGKVSALVLDQLIHVLERIAAFIADRHLGVLTHFLDL